MHHHHHHHLQPAVATNLVVTKVVHSYNSNSSNQLILQHHQHQEQQQQQQQPQLYSPTTQQQQQQQSYQFQHHHHHHPQLEQQQQQQPEHRTGIANGHLGLTHLSTAFHQRRLSNNRTTSFGMQRYFNDNNMNNYASNPVGCLQERFQSRGVTPQYRVVQSHGASHCPTFTYQVFVQDFVAQGEGSSKKQAKHNAARIMLDKLDGRLPMNDGVQPLPPVATATLPTTPSSMMSLTTTTTDGGSNATATTTEDNGSSSGSTSNNVAVVGNTIGQLQELCVRKGIPMPIYDVASMEGQPHQRSFGVVVRVGKLQMKGEGTSKKDAKRSAAAQMVHLLKTENIDVPPMKEQTKAELDSSVTKDVDEDDIIDEDLADRVQKIKLETVSLKDSEKITKFYKSLQDKQCYKLYMLHKNPLNVKNTDYKTILSQLGQELQFDVTHVDLDEKSEDGQVQTLVQISSFPVAVCFGKGRDKERAEQDAAKNALNYLKIMTKKSGGDGEDNNQQQQQQQVKNGNK